MAILTLLEKNARLAKIQLKNICIIGDGYGVLSALFLLKYPNTKITIIDLGKVNLFQSIFLKLNFINNNIKSIFSVEEYNRHDTASVRLIPAERIKSFPNNFDKYDLAINIASFQEMNTSWINYYFSFIENILTTSGLFYCCNREKKILPAGEINEFSQYPWSKVFKTIFSCEAPFYRWFFQRTPTAQSLKICHTPIPFGRLFDGRMLHKLQQK